LFCARLAAARPMATSIIPPLAAFWANRLSAALTLPFSLLAAFSPSFSAAITGCRKQTEVNAIRAELIIVRLCFLTCFRFGWFKDADSSASSDSQGFSALDVAKVRAAFRDRNSRLVGPHP